MVGYATNATLGIDDAIDGRYINDSPTAFTSIINNEEFSIQARPLPFASNDIVPLGFKSDVVATYTISLSHFDGLFMDGQDIYLKDTSNDSTTNLKTSDYTFVSQVGIFNSRFELLFQNSLSNSQHIIDANQVVIYNQNNTIVINSGNIVMSNIKIYDITGRLLFEKGNINASDFKIAMDTENSIYVVKITSTTNESITQKVIN